MIPNVGGRESKSKGQQCHYFAVKTLSELLGGITW